MPRAVCQRAHDDPARNAPSDDVRTARYHRSRSNFSWKSRAWRLGDPRQSPSGALWWSRTRRPETGTGVRRESPPARGLVCPAPTTRQMPTAPEHALLASRLDRPRLLGTTPMPVGTRHGRGAINGEGHQDLPRTVRHTLLHRQDPASCSRACTREQPSGSKRASGV